MSQMDGVSDPRPEVTPWADSADGVVGTRSPASNQAAVSSGSGDGASLVFADGEGLVAASPSGVTPGPAGVAPGQSGGTAASRLVPRSARPTNPGLWDDIDDADLVGAVEGGGGGRGPAEFDLDRWAAESSSAPRVGPMAGVPLRPASTAGGSDGAAGGLTPLPPGAPALDGQSRAAPTFSMPNTQRLAPAGAGRPSSASVVAGEGAGDGRLQPFGSGLSAAPGNHPTEFSAAVGEGQVLQPFSSGLPEPQSVLEGAGSQPQFLPGERHVLRPILRGSLPSSPGGGASSRLGGELVGQRPVTGDAGLSLAAVGRLSGEAAGGTSAWDAPMPGVKPGRAVGSSVGGGSAASVLQPQGSSWASVAASAESRGGPVAGGAAAVHDPLFVQAAEALAAKSALAPGRGSGSSSGVLGSNGTLSSAGTLSLGNAQGPASTAGSLGVGGRGPMEAAAGSAGLEQTRSRGVGRPRPPHVDYIWHEIQQNQTLESISLQYQGDTRLVGPMLELNRDVLPDPQLLPIGRAIRVPIR